MQLAKSLKDLTEFRERNPMLRIVLAGGIFDLFHAGHAKYLNFCKKQGDLLVVHVGSDKSSMVFRGNKKPITPQEQRIELVKNFRAVDLVYSDDSKHRDLRIVKALMPNVLIVSKESVTQEELEAIRKEIPTIEIVYNPRHDDGLSTTELIQKIKAKSN